MTQEEFAALAGFTASTWYRVLSGKRNLSYRNSKKVAAILDCDKSLFHDPDATEAERRAAWELFVRRQSS